MNLQKFAGPRRSSRLCAPRLLQPIPGQPLSDNLVPGPAWHERTGPTSEGKHRPVRLHVRPAHAAIPLPTASAVPFPELQHGFNGLCTLYGVLLRRWPIPRWRPGLPPFCSPILPELRLPTASSRVPHSPTTAHRLSVLAAAAATDGQPGTRQPSGHLWAPRHVAQPIFSRRLPHPATGYPRCSSDVAQQLVGRLKPAAT